MSTVNLSKQTVNLSKGQIINLSKQSNGLNKVMVALGWDEASKSRDGKGFLGRLFSSEPTGEYDLDAWIAFKEKGSAARFRNVVYYGRLEMSSKGKDVAIHHGDNLTGTGDGDDEQISITLANVPEEFDEIIVGVTIYKGYERNQTFKNIKNMFVRVVDENNNFEICRYSDDISDQYSNCYTFIVGKLYKESNGEWNFKSEGYGTKDDSISNAVDNIR